MPPQPRQYTEAELKALFVSTATPSISLLLTSGVRAGLSPRTCVDAICGILAEALKELER